MISGRQNEVHTVDKELDSCLHQPRSPRSENT